MHPRNKGKVKAKLLAKYSGRGE